MTENWIDMPSDELAGRLIEQLTAIAPERSVPAARYLPASASAVPAQDRARIDDEDAESVCRPDYEDVYKYSRAAEKAPVPFDSCASAIRYADAAPEPVIPAAASETDRDGAEIVRNAEIPAGDSREQADFQRAASDPELRLAVLEAVLFAAAAPVDAAELAQVLAWPPDTVQSDLEALEWSLARRGIRLQRIAGACRLVTAAEYAPWVERYLQVHNRVKLSRAQLETLAVIAYNQPITRAVIDTYRGVRSERVLTQLEDLHLIKEVARAEGPGRPILYGTTREFLRYFALNSLDDLPRLFPPRTSLESGVQREKSAVGRQPGQTAAVNEEEPSGPADGCSDSCGLTQPSESLLRLLDRMRRKRSQESKDAGLTDG